MREKNMEKNDKIIHFGTATNRKTSKKSEAEQLLERITKPVLTKYEALSTDETFQMITENIMAATCRFAVTSQIIDAADWIIQKMGSKLDEWKIDAKDFTDSYMKDFVWEAEDKDGAISFPYMPGIRFIKDTEKEHCVLEISVMNCDMNKLMSEEDDKEDAVGLTGYGIKTDADGNRWILHMDDEMGIPAGTWIPAGNSNDPEPEKFNMKKLEHFCDQENISLDGILTMADLYLCKTTEDVLHLAKQHKALLSLKKKVDDFTTVDIVCTEEDERTIPIITPADLANAGCAVYVDGDDYVLCQHADSTVVDDEDESQFTMEQLLDCMDNIVPQMTNDLYFKEVYRTKDPNDLVPVLERLANRYAETFRYIVPLSKDAFAIAETAEGLAKHPVVRKASKEVTEQEMTMLQEAAAGFMRAVARNRIETIMLYEQNEGM